MIDTLQINARLNGKILTFPAIVVHNVDPFTDGTYITRETAAHILNLWATREGRTWGYNGNELHVHAHGLNPQNTFILNLGEGLDNVIRLDELPVILHGTFAYGLGIDEPDPLDQVHIHQAADHLGLPVTGDTLHLIAHLITERHLS